MGSHYESTKKLTVGTRGRLKTDPRHSCDFGESPLEFVEYGKNPLNGGLFLFGV